MATPWGASAADYSDGALNIVATVSRFYLFAGAESAGQGPARAAAENVDGYAQVRPGREPSKGWPGLRGRNHEFCPPAAGRPGGGQGNWTPTGTEGFLGLNQSQGPRRVLRNSPERLDPDG